MEGAVPSWLVCLPPDQAVIEVRVARNIVLCSWARHFPLTVPLSTQGGIDLRWTSIPSRGCRYTSSRFMLQKPG